MSEYEYGTEPQGEEYHGDYDKDYNHPHVIEAQFTDGTSFAVADYDHDGDAEVLVFDKDGDGYVDGGLLDVNNDGVLETAFVTESPDIEYGNDHGYEKDHGYEREHGAEYPREHGAEYPKEHGYDRAQTSTQASLG